MLDNLLVFNGDINSKLKDTYFKSFEPSKILIVVVSFVIIYLIFTLLEYLAVKLENRIYSDKSHKIKDWKVFVIIFASLIVLWLPYILSYFPGGVYADTIAAINQATGEVGITNHNPILYTLIIVWFKVFLQIGSIFGNKLIGLKIFTVVQEIVMALVLAYLVFKLYKNKISIKYIVLTILYFGLFELIPLYVVSLWKDVPFSLALLDEPEMNLHPENQRKIARVLAMLANYGIKIVITTHSDFITRELSLLVMFLRNNGKYIVVLTTFIIILQYRKEIFKYAKKFIISSAVTIVATFIVQGPIYNRYNLNGPFVENLGILNQQLCYVVYVDGNLTDYQKEFIGKVIPLESIKEHYTPLDIDNIKWGDTGFSESFLSENKKEYFKVWFKVFLQIKVWFKVFLQNPKEYVVAYLYNTVGYWDMTKSIFFGYTQEEMWPGLEKKDPGYIQSDFIKDVTGSSIRNILKPKTAISSAIFFVVTLVFFNLVLFKKKYKYLLVFVPALLTYLSILVATPVAFTLRYIYILVLTIPLYFFLAFDKNYIEE
ncbi:MAG: hypothetical protein BHW07_03835 [Clostridium sp. CAG_433_25_7]|nr:MAG: hypothetical protein BHW07_03835 [Clostridium sp. CAG_433_25_7]